MLGDGEADPAISMVEDSEELLHERNAKEKEWSFWWWNVQRTHGNVACREARQVVFVHIVFGLQVQDVRAHDEPKHGEFAIIGAVPLDVQQLVQLVDDL